MASFLELLITTIVSTIPAALVVPHRLGKGPLGERDATPRVIWVRSDKSPSRLVETIPNTSAQRILCHESIPVDIHILAADHEDTETIVDAEVRALYTLLGPYSSYLQAQVGTFGGNDELKTFGVEAILKVNVPRPIYSDTPPTARINTFNFAPGVMTEPGWITTQV